MSRAYETSAPQETPDERAVIFFSSQFGLITRNQALALGHTKSTIHRPLLSGRWNVVLPGIYALAGVPPSWHQRLKAATLAVDGAASHSSAACLWRFPGCPPGAIEVRTVRDRRAPDKGIIVHKTASLEECDLARIQGIDVTSPARTLRELLDARPRGYVPTQSPLETRAARRILRALESQGLPAPVRQYVVKDRGRFVAQVDFAYPHVKLAIEAQSVKHHAGRQAWARDNKRIAHLAAIGWRTMPVLWDDTKDNLCAAIDRIRRAVEDPKLFE